MSTQRCILGAAVVLLLALTGHAETVPSGGVAPTLPRNIIYNANLNALIDSNMHVIRSMLSGLDPLKMEDVKMPLTKNIFMELSTGWMQNLSQLERAGKCSVRYTNRIITLDMNFSWGEVAVDYRYLLKVLLGKRKGDVHGQLSDLKVHIVVDLNLEACEVRLRRLEFTDTERITIKLEGHRTDFIFNLMIKTVTFLFKDLILETIESSVLNIIQSSIDEINYLIGKNHNRMIQLVRLVIPFDYENGINPTPIDSLSAEETLNSYPLSTFDHDVR